MSKKARIATNNKVPRFKTLDEQCSYFLLPHFMPKILNYLLDS